MSISELKWKRIAMDFVVGLPKTLGKFDSIWLVVDRLTKSAHFILIRIDYNAEQLAKVYVKEIMRLHGVPLSIILDCAFHPQTDRQSEWTIQVLEAMLRACVIDFGGHWNKKCETFGVDLVKDVQDKVRRIQAKLLAAQSRQKKYVDHKVAPMKGVMRFGKKGKLSPQYIGPFEILECVGPRYHGDGDYIIKWNSIVLDKDLQYEEEPIAILDRDVCKLRTKEIKFVMKVQWKYRPVEKATWETERNMQDKNPQLYVDSAHYFVQAALAVLCVTLAGLLWRVRRNIKS
ncbi:hypothetical protein KY290_012930 [Solanum tuberosum]|uniref:Uncharacterized protein n=1 Tax=Solanum tuberosum TaxID=4113 RepID=A0ABQ7VKC1_SOLTU|nr:hypothetical protein KY285_012699 [Solanum tuberosum]KAH0768949.1 hypothetical protein KY290_012930 [Solanum tuberosum]